MINLLPPLEKQNLKLEEKNRLISILAILFLIFLIFLILIFLSINFYLWGELESQRANLESKEKELKTTEIQSLEEKIEKLNLTLSQLNSFYQKNISLAAILEKISKILPQRTYLTNVSITPHEKELSFGLSGFAPNREILVELKQNLRSQADFEEIYFPPSNWVNPSDIDFYLTFKIKID